MIVSLNFFSLIKFSKKFTEELLKKDLAVSKDFGTINADNNICNNDKKIENLNKKLINLNLFTPKFQKMINSLFSSYFEII